MMHKLMWKYNFNRIFIYTLMLQFKFWKSIAFILHILILFVGTIFLAYYPKLNCKDILWWIKQVILSKPLYLLEQMSK